MTMTMTMTTAMATTTFTTTARRRGKRGGALAALLLATTASLHAGAAGASSSGDLELVCESGLGIHQTLTNGVLMPRVSEGEVVGEWESGRVGGVRGWWGQRRERDTPVSSSNGVAVLPSTSISTSTSTSTSHLPPPTAHRPPGRLRHGGAPAQGRARARDLGGGGGRVPPLRHGPSAGVVR